MNVLNLRGTWIACDQQIAAAYAARAQAERDEGYLVVAASSQNMARRRYDDAREALMRLIGSPEKD